MLLNIHFHMLFLDGVYVERPVSAVFWNGRGCSYSEIVASVMVLEHPDLVSGMMHYEPASMSVIADLPEGQAALEQWDQRTAHAVETLQAGDAAQAAKLFIEAVFERPPGGLSLSIRCRERWRRAIRAA